MRRAGIAAALLLAAARAGAVDCREPAADCTLREAAAQAGLWYGAAVSPGPLDGDPDYGPTLARETNSLTPENHLKWDVVHPAPGVWDFTEADRLVAFAETNGMRVRGHNLVWDQQLVDSTPAYVTAMTDPDALRALLAEHIHTVVGRYRGRIETWDVVNEPLQTLGSALYDNVFHRLLGPGYVAEALRLAHEADPDAVLVLNEVQVSAAGPKFDALLALARELLDQGAPLAGIGIQGHFFGTPNPAALQANIEALAALGLSVELTEVDVLLRGAGDAAARLERQRLDYLGVAAACTAVPACRGITTWGITDAHTWIDSFIGPGLAPLPFDEAYARKPAFSGLREGLLAGLDTTRLAGRRLVLRDGKPARRALRLVSRDGAIGRDTGPGSAGDPARSGGTLRVFTTGGDSFDTTYALPAARWRYARAKRPERGWVFAGGGPIRRVRVLAGRLVAVRGRGAGLGHSLVADPAPVHVELTLGARRYCLVFGGDTKRVGRRRWVARRAPAPAACNGAGAGAADLPARGTGG